MFDTDPDPDSDPEKTFEKRQTPKLTALSFHPEIPFFSPPLGGEAGSVISKPYTLTLTLSLKGEGING
jgi:hypothetical protein